MRVCHPEAKTDQNKTIQLSHSKKGIKKKKTKGERKKSRLTAALLLLRILRLANVDDLATFPERVLGRVTLERLAGDDTVDFWNCCVSHVRLERSTAGIQTCQNVLEGKFDVAGVKGRGLNERQVVLAYVAVSATHFSPPWGTQRKHTRKLLGLFRGHSPQVSQIALVSDQHDDDVGIRWPGPDVRPFR